MRKLNAHKLSNALHVFRAEGMTISKMRECIDAWQLGADFTEAWSITQIDTQIDKFRKELDKEETKVIYVCAPYSHPDIIVRDYRMAAFSNYMAQQLLKGNVVVSPLMCHYLLPFEPKLKTDWGTWKEYSTTLMERSDEVHVLTLQGWEESTGVQQELQLALLMHLPIWYPLNMQKEK